MRGLDKSNAGKALAPVYETIERVVAELPKNVPLIGFCGAPWTVATYMVEGGGSKEQASARLFAYRDRATFQRLIDLLVESSADYLVGQVKAGASALQIFDSWAGSLPEDEFARWCIAPTKRIVELVKAAVPRNANDRLPARRQAPLPSATPRRPASMPWAATRACRSAGSRRNCRSLVPVQGNLDPLLLVAGGPELDARVARDPCDTWARTLHLQSRPWHSARDAHRACHEAVGPGEGAFFLAQPLALPMLLAYIKAFHVIAIIAWMAGLLYLPRLFVYHATSKRGSEQSETFKVMERRLLRYITTPAMLASWVLGLILAFSGAIDWSRDGWFHAKLILVIALSAYSGLLAMWTKDFALDRNTRSARFYRIANEIPTLLMIGIVILVVVRPF